MHAIYLISRREYLSYVATWGFWLSLASVPLFMVVGIMLPGWIESAEPTRVFVVIDETGDDGNGRYREAVIQRADARRITSMAESIQAMDEALGLEGAMQQAVDLQSLPGNGRYLQVPPPARTVEELRPYLTGDRLVDSVDPPQPLQAAIFIREDSESGVSMDYWSTNVSDESLKDNLGGALRELLREERLRDAGVSAVTIAQVNALNPQVRSLNPERQGEDARVTAADRIPLVVGALMAFMLWTVVFSVVNMLLTAMIEEKGNKVLETLLSTARYHEILIGKLLGVAAVSFTLVIFWGGLGSTLSFLSGNLLAQQSEVIADIMAAITDPTMLAAALGYFIVGYLLFGSLFLAVGSLCETLQEAQTLMGPIFLIMMIPLFIVMVSLESPDSPIVAFASWVPFWTPFVMLARLPTDPPASEILMTTGVMLGTMVVIVWAAGAVFRMGALNHANSDTVRGWLRFGRKKA
jgi:ABC-2 type transport system permease protein